MSLSGRNRESAPMVRGIYLCVLFIVIVSCVRCLEAATTYRKPAQTITPVQDTAKTNKGRVMDPAFANAGKVAGLEIWRIENFKPVAYPKPDYGKFYSGDSYVMLFTKEKNRVFSWDIHFWLGSQTSQDEAGAAAILSVQLDDQLGGSPIQYREVQEHESQMFLSHFKSGVRYLPGGVQSGFAHVDRNRHETKLYHIKGKRNIRVKQVDVTIASMNKGDCFILDIGSDVYVYVGSKAKRVERLKAISAANQIRDQDHGGRAKVHIIDEFSSEDEVISYFKALGGGSQLDVPDESAGGDDDQFEKNEEKTVALYKVSDATGKLQVQSITQKPLLQTMLDTNDCFILDTTDSNLYVWVGKKCNNKEKSEAMTKAQDFLTTKKYPAWTQVTRIIEGAEPTSFQQYFKTWKGTGELHSRLIRSAQQPKPTKLEEKSAGEAPEYMPDLGKGEVEIFRIEDFEPVPVPKNQYGKFYGGDSYIVKYQYNGRYILYIWQGATSSHDEKTASAIHAVLMDNELGGRATQIRVTQDFEPKHFLHIFKGKLIIYLGGKASGFKNVKERDSYVEGKTKMFRIRGTNDYNVKASQQIPVAKYLASDDVFIVSNCNNTWIWKGTHSDKVEQDLAAGFVTLLAPEHEPITVQEGVEPELFWKALDGKDTYSKASPVASAAAMEPKLFHAVLLKNNKLKLEEIQEFGQDDLVQDDVMLLDTGSALYIWIGNDADDIERKEALQVSQKYLAKLNRLDTVTIVIKQGSEPKAFTSVFTGWDEDLWKEMPSYKELKAKFGY